MHLKGFFGQPLRVRGLVVDEIGGFDDSLTYICRELYWFYEIGRQLEFGLKVGHVWQKPVC
jgi:hypothetical protein